MTRSILCAVDVHQATPHEKPLQVAAEMAEREGARLDVVTVVPDLGYGQVSSFLPSDYSEKATAAARNRLDEIVDRVVGNRIAEVGRHVATGRVATEVLRLADAAGTDLIVVGSHEPEAIDRLLGTNASQIVLHATASVYVVR